MCNPALAIGAAAQVGGLMLQQQAARKAQSARGAALGANTERNTALETEARGAMDSSADEFNRGNFDAGTGAETSRLAGMYDNATSNNVLPTASSSGAPAIVADTNAAKLAEAEAYGKDLNQKLANLNSFGSYLANTISPKMNDSAAVGQMMGNFMKGNDSVLQLELENANQKAYSPMAQLLTTGGQVGTNYGLYKAG
jgi:hypothetical protein